MQINPPSRSLAAEIRSVVQSDRCSGCGVCTHLDPGVRMVSQGGYLRPHVAPGVSGRREADREVVRHFRRMCPGVRVSAGDTPDGGVRHPYLGPVIGCYRAHATSAVLRDRGSSGGVLSALTGFLVSEGYVSHAVAAAADGENPRRTVSVTIRSKDEVLAASGSRYAPVACGAHPLSLDPDAAVVGKPCEASALRALVRERGGEPPILLSFFCAGTPNQESTDSLVEKLGLKRSEPLSDLWYRGRGWPGRFTAVSAGGKSVSTSYEESWGANLGRTVQWRCRTCADGVGESADISAGDFWEATGSGYPDFTERPGESALIARTRRGAEIVQAAVRAGVIVAEPVDPDEVIRVQPYQYQRRKYLLARLVGTAIDRQWVPRYSGFGLARFAMISPRRSWAELRGTRARLRMKSEARGKG